LSGWGIKNLPIGELDSEFYTYLGDEVHRFNRMYGNLDPVNRPTRLSLARQWVGLDPPRDIGLSDNFAALMETKSKKRIISFGTGMMSQDQSKPLDVSEEFWHFNFEANNIKDNFVGKQIFIYKSSYKDGSPVKCKINYVSGNALSVVVDYNDLTINWIYNIEKLSPNEKIGPYYYEVIDEQPMALYNKAVKEFFKAIESEPNKLPEQSDKQAFNVLDNIIKLANYYYLLAKY